MRQKAYFIQLALFVSTNHNRMAPGIFDAMAAAAIDVISNPVVANPYASFDRTARDAPAPIHMERKRIDSGAPLTFLGIARLSD